ncbi:tRNA (adenosine(37)-N6)-threonylcarbamoyltransferase complex dimerization subunit type 1 TsaB [Nocardioides cavernaquae]|uniref:tRNA (Adenosine(37)-N6)-threonylcarbamoyltransferase complex dimerization subunit type 1 TsaB n=1 Tax=Nocardioides cavernaquae TaxID=2321396 RepID=A0A3A5H6D4_9ACTN|nr:tRNA (adenosine(37)-N6)-threonylcarbamoyltransferase complex dimerization subunit type 1 TsaB [Nocardioides cavernaquae]RJS46246.1 tRNA (adenosine(37)-N6)-threonylcarbamoyltransferase complex dimerization subunit type 1 TsaB [Nocardioides cavernaquae]
MLLALDTATAQVAVALYDGTDVVAEERSEQSMKHGEHLAPMIATVLAAAHATVADITAIGVGVGPGPFTGLRVGLVTARTLGMVLGVPVHGVCTLDVLAAEAVARGAVVGDFLVATDARRKEVYLAAYDATGARLSGPEVIRPVDAASTLPTAGEGATLYPDSFPNAVYPFRPSAGWLARLVAAGTVPLLDPEPLYLRRPDAVASAGPKKVS